MATRADRIAKVPGGFQVMSLAGKPLGKPFKTRAEAKKRLQQIEAGKSARGDSTHTSVRRFDFLQDIHFDKARKDGALATVDPETGFLRVDARLGRTGVQIYRDGEGNSWGELRTDDEVFSPESMRSFEGVVVTDDHPDEFVSTRNVKDVQKGQVVGPVRRDGDLMAAFLEITDDTLIAKMRAGKTMLSNGYTADVIPHEGITDDGHAHSFRQTNMRGNHTAVVDIGRAGERCRALMDAGDAYTTHEDDDPMKTRKIKIGGVEYTVDVKTADAIEAQEKEVQDALEKEAKERGFESSEAFQRAISDAGDNLLPFLKGADKDEEDEDKKKGDSEEGAKKDDSATLQARIDILESDAQKRADGETLRIDERANLISDTRRVSREIVTDGRKTEDIMRDVVLEVRPEYKDKLAAHKDSPGYLRCLYDDALLHRAAQDAESSELDTALALTVLNGGSGKKEDEDLNQIRTDYLDRLGTRQSAVGED